MNSKPGSSISTRLLIILALCSGVSPFATDAYLPGMPQIADEFGVSASLAQLTLTTFMLSLGLGQLIIGAYSDQWGRKKLLLFGMIGTTVAALICSVAPNIWVLIIARAFQGFCGASGAVLGRAVVSDIAHGLELSRAFGLLMAIGALAPIIAPVAGGLIVPFWGWRPVFWFLTFLSGLTALLVAFFVSETLPEHERTSGGLKEVLSSMGHLLREKVFSLIVLLMVAQFGVLFTYVSASSFVLQNIGGMSEGLYAFAFAFNSSFLLLSNLASPRMTTRYGSFTTLAISAAGTTLAVIWLGLATFVLPPSWWTFMIGFSAVTTMAGLTFPTAATLLIIASGKRRGTGSAVQGAAQFLMGALVAPLATIAGESSAVPMVIVMALCITIQIVALRALSHSELPQLSEAPDLDDDSGKLAS